jgi:hypothetical protein
MDAAPAHDLHGPGAPRLLRHFAALERLTSAEGPSGWARLESELGGELAALLVGALTRSHRVDKQSLPLCAVS